jgi:hypothetical protein
MRVDPTTRERAPTGGVYAAADTKWLLPGPLLGTVRPKPADTILDGDGVTWTILAPEFDKSDRVWSCYSIALAIVHALADSVTLWRRTNAQDAAMSRVPTFAQVGSAVDARIQLTAETETQERGKALWKKTYDIYLASELDATAEDQVRDAAGNVYQVESIRNRERIDELSVITCTRNPD